MCNFVLNKDFIDSIQKKKKQLNLISIKLKFLLLRKIG